MAMGGDKDNPNVIEVHRHRLRRVSRVSGYDGHRRLPRLHRAPLRGRLPSAAPSPLTSTSTPSSTRRSASSAARCAKVCPYSAIINQKRPCENACKVKAIQHGRRTLPASIDNDKCIACGACVYQCPFGAITDKSYILDVVEPHQEAATTTRTTRLYAVVAPSISSQFTYAKLGQVITGIKKLGFYHVVEAALGADMVAYAESEELAEKGFLTSSCCPAFVDYIEKAFPTLAGPHFSQPVAHGATIAKYIKETDPDCKIVFIGPCTAKKAGVPEGTSPSRTSTASSPSRSCRRCLTAGTSTSTSLHGRRAGQRLLLSAASSPAAAA